MHYEPLNLDEIMALKESLEPAFSTQLLPLLISLNTNERLTQFLDLIDQRCLIHPEADGHIHLPDKKILVLGSSKVKDEHIYKTFEEQKISKHRVELHTEYEPSKINIDSLKYSLKYSLILVGPMPHIMEGKGPYTSVINRLEEESGFPRVKRLTARGELKITKESLKTAINEALDQKWIV